MYACDPGNDDLYRQHVSCDEFPLPNRRFHVPDCMVIRGSRWCRLAVHNHRAWLSDDSQLEREFQYGWQAQNIFLPQRHSRFTLYFIFKISYRSRLRCCKMSAIGTRPIFVLYSQWATVRKRCLSFCGWITGHAALISAYPCHIHQNVRTPRNWPNNTDYIITYKWFSFVPSTNLMYAALAAGQLLAKQFTSRLPQMWVAIKQCCRQTMELQELGFELHVNGALYGSCCPRAEKNAF